MRYCLCLLLMSCLVFVCSLPVKAQDLTPSLPSFQSSLVDDEIINLDTRALSPFSTYKDPFTAGMLSFFWVGIGQIYNEDYYKGSVLLFADLTEKLLITGLLIRFRLQYGGNNQSVLWTDLTGTDKALILSAGIVYAGLWIYSIIDAYQGALEYNRHYFSQPSLELGLFVPDRGMGLQLSTRF